MKNKRNQTTIYDVGYKANVSPATVSRVLNDRAGVPDETREKVLKAVSDLNYKPSPLARGLMSKKVDLIQVCFSWSSGQYHIDLANPWYLELLNGITQVAQEKGYGLLINTLSGVFDPQEVYHRVSRNAVDGILLVSPYLGEEDLPKIKNYPIPVVLIGCRVDDPRVDYVDSDNVKAVAGVVDHLVSLGHKKIACITGEVEISADAAERSKKFRTAMAGHGLEVPKEFVVSGDFSRESGVKAMKDLMGLKKKPTAVFATNDLMALGAWDVLTQKGWEVGKDMALVGFDDIAAASKKPYSLTTVKQDFHAISTQATNLLMDKIQKPDEWRTRQVLVPTQLVIRRSSGPRLRSRG